MTKDEWISTEELAERWDMSAGTLSNWRIKRIGPPYQKIMHKVRYQLADIIRYENKKKRITRE